MKNKHIIFIILGIITLARLFYINHLPFLGDEAYYWQWAKHLDWGFYEQGPMTALVIWFFTLFTNINTVFTVRLGGVILSLAAMITAYFTFKRFMPEDTEDKNNLLNILLLNSSLIYAIGAVLMMHDTVMFFFYALFLHNMTRLIKAPEKSANWAIAGILLGLGIMSKLTMGTVYFGVAAFLLLTGTFKKYLKGFLIFTLCAFIVTLPYIYWNFTHGFATVKYLFIRGGSSGGFTFRYFLELLGSQAGLISPFLFILFIPAFIKSVRKAEFSAGFAFSTLFWASIIPFFILSLRSRIEANWPAFTFLPLFFIASAYIASLGKKTARAVSTAVVIPGMLLITFVYIQAVRPLVTIPEKNDPLKKTYGYKELSSGVNNIFAALPEKDKVFFASRHYQTASLLRFYLPSQPEVYILMNHESNKNYRFWKGYEALKGQNCLFVYSDPWESSEMSVFFEKRSFTGEIEVAIPGLNVRKYHVDYFTGLK